jgi:hypothetical protein
VADTRTAGVTNVFADEWEEIYPPTEGWRSNTRRLVPRGCSYVLDDAVDYFDGEQPQR